MSAHISKSERGEAIDRLREWLKPGDTIFTILRHVSRSGMQRVISCIKIDSDAERTLHGRVSNSMHDLSGNVATACEYVLDRDRFGVKVSGAGQDMGFAVVYDLARRLWPDGFGCIGEGCMSNDHSNGDRDYRPHCLGYDKDGKPNGVTCELPGCMGVHWHRDGGYALQQRWL